MKAQKQTDRNRARHTWEPHTKVNQKRMAGFSAAEELAQQVLEAYKRRSHFAVVERVTALNEVEGIYCRQSSIGCWERPRN